MGEAFTGRPFAAVESRPGSSWQNGPAIPKCPPTQNQPPNPKWPPIPAGRAAPKLSRPFIVAECGKGGVVHGSYQSVMEMYGGESIERASFESGGTGARFSGYRHSIGLHIHNALNQVSKVAYNLGHTELAIHPREVRRKFEKSPGLHCKMNFRC